MNAFSSGSSGATRCVGPRQIHGLSICIDSAPAYGVLVVHVGPDATMMIGLTGNGLVARTIIHSIRPG